MNRSGWGGACVLTPTLFAAVGTQCTDVDERQHLGRRRDDNARQRHVGSVRAECVLLNVRKSLV